MNQDVLLSKIVASPTESTWSQAYSTLNVYVALSVEQEGQESIAALGKELLERIQREFFALDQKNLDTIKEAVSAASEVTQGSKYSIVLTTITNSTLYIVIAGEGSVVIRRGEKLGVVASGEEGKIEAFSGPLKHDDIIILETGDFQKRVPMETISKTLDHLEVSEISENLAPMLHENAKGTEAAIILQYKNLSQNEETKEALPQEKHEKITDENPNEESAPQEPPRKISLPSFRLPSIPINNLFKLKKGKGIIGIAIVVILIILGSSLFVAGKKKEEQKREVALSQFLSPLQKKYDEAVSLLDLNKGLALDEFSQVKDALDKSSLSFPKDSTQQKKLSEFIKKVSDKLSSLEASSTLTNQKVFFDATSQDIKEISLITTKGGDMVVANKNGSIDVLDSSGKVKKAIKTKESVDYMNSDSSNIYAVSGSNLVKIDKKSGAEVNITKSAPSSAGIDSFYSNVYVLNTKDSTVDKYQAPDFSKKAYFQSGITLDGPTSISIDSSIWITQSGGQVRRFTKGAEDAFSIKNLSKPLGKDTTIFTDQDYNNIYVLDKANARIIVIDKEGNYKTQYNSKDLAKTTSFVIDEKGKKGHIVSDNKIVSFDL